jgi:hypothetical protein
MKSKNYSNQLTLIEWSIEPEYSLLAPTTSVTTARVWPFSDAAGSKQLVATLNFHAKIAPSCSKIKLVQMGRQTIYYFFFQVRRAGRMGLTEKRTETYKNRQQEVTAFHQGWEEILSKIKSSLSVRSFS